MCVRERRSPRRQSSDSSLLSCVDSLTGRLFPTLSETERRPPSSASHELLRLAVAPRGHCSLSPAQLVAQCRLTRVYVLSQLLSLCAACVLSKSARWERRGLAAEFASEQTRLPRGIALLCSPRALTQPWQTQATRQRAPHPQQQPSQVKSLPRTQSHLLPPTLPPPNTRLTSRRAHRMQRDRHTRRTTDWPRPQTSNRRPSHPHRTIRRRVLPHRRPTSSTLRLRRARAGWAT